MKIQLKRSNVLDSGVAKTPSADQLEYGEIAINYNNSDPSIFMKDSNNQVIRISGENAVGMGQTQVPIVATAPSNPVAGNQYFDTDDNRLYVYTGSAWVRAEPLLTTIADLDVTNTLDISGTANFTSNVGFGVSSPSHALDISNASNAYIRQTQSNSTLRLGPAGTSASDGAFIGTDTTGPLRFYTNGSSNERLRIDTEGRVGINEVSPVGILHVKEGESGVTPNTTHDTLFIENDDDGGITIGSPNNKSGYLAFADPQDNDIAKIQYAHTDNQLSFTVNAGVKAVINSTGNVGIGTESPSQKLTVKGTAAYEATNSTNAWLAYTYTDNTYRLNYNGAGADEVVIDSSGRVGIGNEAMSSFTGNASDNLVVGSGSGGEGITVYSATDNQGSITFADGTSGDAAYSGALEYSHTVDKFAFRTASTGNRMVIDRVGNVGIGETDPSANLVVRQSGSTFTAQSQTVALFQRSSTTGHGAKIAIVAGNAASSDINFGDTDDEDAGLIQYVHTNNSFKFCTASNTTSRLTIDSSGNITIPGNLTVNGSFSQPSGDSSVLNSASVLQVGTTGNFDLELLSNNNKSIVVKNTGKVGIGTDNPTFTDGSGVHIAASSGALKLQNTTNGNWAYVEYADESNTTKYIQGYRDSTGLYAIRPGATLSAATGITVDSSGKVGLGCTPVRDLQIHASDASSELMISNSTTGSSAGNGFMIQQDGNDTYIWNKENSFLSLGTNSTGRLKLGSTGNLEFTSASSSAQQELLFSDGTSGRGRIIYRHDGDSLAFETLSTGAGTNEAMRILSSGNIGIGTSSPDSTLHVHTGTAGTVTPNSGADDLVVENSGDCGISLLTADGNNTTALFFGCPTQSVGAAIRYNNSTHEMSLGPDDPDSSTSLRINTGDGVEAMRILSNKNVGVGLNNPSYEFHVKGAGTVAFFEGTGGNGFIGIKDSDDGSIGFIGVDGGNIKFQTSGASYADSFVITSTGNAEFAGTVETGGGYDDSTGGVSLYPAGGIISARPSNSNAYVWQGYKAGTGVTSTINADGSASFGGTNTQFFADGEAQIAGNKINFASNGAATLRSTTFKHGTPSTGTCKFTINPENNSQVTLAYDDEGSVVFGTSSDPATQANFSSRLTLTSAGVAQFAKSVEVSDNILSTRTGATHACYVGQLNSTVTSTILASGTAGFGATNNTSYDGIAQTLLVANEGGNAGITIRSGGSSPFGAIHFADGTNGNAEKRAGRIYYQHSVDSMVFSTGNIEALRINSGGHVGIGTDSPGAALEIYRDSIPAIKLNDGGDYQAYMQLAGNDLEIRSSSGQLEFYTGAADGASSTKRLTISNTGNLLFNQEASSNYPEQKLKWSNDSTTTNGFYISQDSSRNGRVWHEQGLDILFGTTDSEAMRIDYDGRLRIGASSGTFTNERLVVKGSNAAGSGVFIHNPNGATNSSADLWFGNWSGSTTATAQARIQALNTNVNTAATDLVFSTYNGSAIYPRMRIDSGGNLLLGTDTAATDADVTIRATAPQLSLYATPGNITRITMGDTDDHDIGIVGYDNNTNSMFFNVNTGTRLTIDSTGNSVFGGAITTSSLSAQSSATASWFQTGTGISGANYVWAAKNSSSNVWHSGLQTDGDLYLGGNLTSANNIGLSGSNGTGFFGGTAEDRILLDPGSGSYDGDPSALVVARKTNDGLQAAFKVRRYDNSNNYVDKVVIDYAGNFGIGDNFIPAGASNNTLGAINKGMIFKGADAAVGIKLQSTAGSGGIMEMFAESGGFSFDTRGSGYMRFKSAGSEFMRINGSTGYMGVGADSNLFYRITLPEGDGDGSRIGWRSASGNRKASIDCGNTDSLVFRTGATENPRMRITSDGNVAVDMTTNVQGKLSVFSGTDFTTASQGGNDNIYLVSDATSGNNVYGASIAFSRVQYPDRRAAAIASVQTSADEDNVGLAFFTHPSNDAADAIVEAMRIDSGRNLHIGNTTASAHGNRVLQVGDTSRAATYVEIRTSTTGDGGLLFSDGTAGDTTGYRGTIEYSHNLSGSAPDALLFRTAATEALRLTSTGNAVVAGQVNADSATGSFQASRTDGGANHVFRGGTSTSNYTTVITADGDASFGGEVKITGAKEAYKSNGTFTLANDATTTFNIGYAAFFVITVTNCSEVTNGTSGAFFANTASSLINEISDPFGDFTENNNVANTTGVTKTAGSNLITIRNDYGQSATYCVAIFGTST